MDTNPAPHQSVRQQSEASTITAHRLDAVLGDLADLLETIPGSADTDPTPCTEYDTATLRRHVVGWLTAFADGFSSPNGRCSDFDVVTVEGTGAEQVRTAAGRLTNVLPEAATRPLFIGEASLPGDMALSMILWEYQMHGWDLAVATGRPWAPAEDGLLASLDFAPAMLTPDFQGPGRPFAPAVDVPADSPVLDRLLGLSGRDPHWTP
ncbi:TIGR03086 family metal-binding protein [Brevibacterium samyangense]|uniref:TIGR03086 family metal-binding protein n=1 Tax=Brevibacterium samyangense TaxID=366888 RepID=A0ABN2T2T3_9MICO